MIFKLSKVWKSFRFIEKLQIFFVILIALFACFYGLDSAPLEKWDEQAYFEIVKTSLENDSFLIPTLESNDPDFYNITRNNNHYYEKPPLWFWAAYAFSYLFGLNILSLRLISAISGFIIIILIIYIGTKYKNLKVGLMSALIFMATGHMFISNAGNIFSTHNIRSINPDILHILFILLSQIFALRYIENRKNFSLYLLGVFTGLAILTKGFFSLMTPLIFLFYILFIERIKFPQFIIIISKILTPLLIIAVPWYIYVYLHGGNEFIVNHFLYHNISRIIWSLDGHQKTWYFHIVNLFTPQIFLFGPFFLVGSFLIRNKIKKYFYFQLLIFPWATLFIISMVQTRLSWYALYIYPFASILAAIAAQSLIAKTKSMFYPKDERKNYL